MLCLEHGLVLFEFTFGTANDLDHAIFIALPVAAR